MTWQKWLGLFIHIKQDPNQTQREWRSHSGPCRLSKTEGGWDCRIPKPRLQISPHPGTHTFSDFTSQVGSKCPNKIGQLYISNSSVYNYLVHVPAVEILHGGESIAMLVHERLADFIAVPVEAPVPVVGDTVATKEIAAGEVKSVKLQNFDEIDQKNSIKWARSMVCAGVYWKRCIRNSRRIIWYCFELGNGRQIWRKKVCLININNIVFYLHWVPHEQQQAELEATKDKIAKQMKR